MIKNFWKQSFKELILITIPTLGASISLLAAFSISFENTLKKWGIIGGIIACLVCLLITLIRRINEIILAADKKSTDNTNNNENFINSLFKIAALFIKYPNGHPLINIHYFSYNVSQNVEYLYKERKYGYESESLSIDYSLDRCPLNSSNIVMCQAFKDNRVTFKNLPDDHISTYDSDVKNYIDKNIKWVLACPVWDKKDHSHRLGVVVIFGLKEIAKDSDIAKIKSMENLCVELSKSMSAFL